MKINKQIIILRKNHSHSEDAVRTIPTLWAVSPWAASRAASHLTEMYNMINKLITSLAKIYSHSEDADRTFSTHWTGSRRLFCNASAASVSSLSPPITWQCAVRWRSYVCMKMCLSCSLRIIRKNDSHTSSIVFLHTLKWAQPMSSKSSS